MSVSRAVFRSLRRLGLGLSLIAATGFVLLMSDLGQRPRHGGMPRVAVFQYNSTESLEMGVHGLTDSLRQHGWEAPRTMEVRFFNAEGDVGTANSIARELVSRQYTHIITVSTNCLQVVARANREGKVTHIFGVVADPIAAGVSINPNNPYDHPKHLVGIGTLMPVGELLEIARQMNPRLQIVGLPWNPAETNSQVYTRMAREAAGRLGLTLLEANVENTAAVGEATDSLAARGAEAILMTGDVTVSAGASTLIASARKARIPVFGTLPSWVGRGPLFAMGADYYRVGWLEGELAARVLSGEPPAKMPILYQIPKLFVIDRSVPPSLRDRWVFPPDVVERAKDTGHGQEPR